MGIVLIYIFSHLSFSLFFLPLSGMDGWVTCDLSPFQQNFSDIRTLGGSWMAVCNGIPCKIAKFPPLAGPESGTASLADWLVV